MRTRAGLKVFSAERVGLRPPSQPLASTGQITHVSVHHGGPVGGPRWTFRKAKETVLQWDQYHRGKGWSMIGYNLLVDGYGRLYAGRPVGKLPAAVGDHNTGSVGICFMQDGRSHGLTVLQRRTLKILFRHGVPELGLPPLKTLKVKGHQEYSGHESNECPGQKIMRHLRWRRRRG